MNMRVRAHAKTPCVLTCAGLPIVEELIAGEYEVELGVETPFAQSHLIKKKIVLESVVLLFLARCFKTGTIWLAGKENNVHSLS